MVFGAAEAAGQQQGYLDGAGCSSFSGWAWNGTDNTRVTVDFIDNTMPNFPVLLGTVTANLFRPDLQQAGIGDGSHAFQVPTPASIKDSQNHAIVAKFSNGAWLTLNGGSPGPPPTVNCNAQTPAYSYSI
jgi:hypothetical protein